MTKLDNRNPSQFLSILISNLNRNIINQAFYGQIYSTTQTILSDYIHSGYAVFIDEVDKNVEKLMQNHKNDRSKLTQLQNIWISSQVGLVYAVYRICSDSSHIRIYATIRQEILGKMGDDPNRLRYKDIMFILNYNKNDLKNIFLKGIESWERHNLVKEDLYKKEKIQAFLGFEEVQPLKFPSPDKIPIFEYFYIYTIQRPRDIMFLGGKISEIPPMERNPIMIQELVNENGWENLYSDYLKNFEYLLNIDFKKMFACINKNILSRYEVMNICRDYNAIEKGICNCQKCSGEHIFSLLYKIGVLGTLVKNHFKDGVYKQFFLPPEERDLLIATSELPDSDFDLFFLHPALAHYISKAGNHNTQLNFDFRPIFIGDGCETKLATIRSIIQPDFKKIIDPERINEDEIREQLFEMFGETLQKNYIDSRKEAHSKSLEFIRNHIHRFYTKNKSIVWLDVGCGEGRCLNVFNIFIEEDQNWSHDIHYIGIDENPNLLTKAEELAKIFEKNGLKASFAPVKAQEIYQYPKYDLISSIFLLHEIDPPLLPYILQRMLYALKEEGYLVIYDFQEPIEKEPRIVVWDKADIKYIMENAFGARPSCQKMVGTDFPEERIFFSCYVHPNEQLDEKKFKDFLEQYPKFINNKIRKLQKRHDDLENQFKTRVQQILQIADVKLSLLSGDEVKKISNEIEPIYKIKFQKMKLINQEILYLIKRFPKVSYDLS
jgi:SAM-dependent methyltransferase